MSDSVCICIPTFRRPEGLRRLLASLDRLRFTGPAPGITLAIADNDPQNPLRQSHPDFASWSSWPMLYEVEPEPGLAAVRNRLLAMAPPDCGFVAMVDDDEAVGPFWLDALMAVRCRFHADVVFGPVRAQYMAVPPRWMREGRFHELGPFEDGTRFDYAISGNCLIRREAIGGERFDPAFGSSGGEDQEFFHRLSRKGALIIASREAYITETVTPERMRLSWLLRRAFRTGTTLARLDRLHGGAAAAALRVAKSAARASAGALRLAASPFTGKAEAVTGLCEMARGAGGILGLFGASLRIYHRAAFCRLSAG